MFALRPPEAFASANANWAPGVVAGLPANAAGSAGTQLTSVSCPSVGDCAAGGEYTDNSGHVQGLLVSESSGVWAAGVEGALPAGAGLNPLAGVNSVSCAASSDCAAVGNYLDSSGAFQGVLWTESSGAWATGVEASLASPPADAFLNSVSCGAAGDCSAVGQYRDGSGSTRGLLLTETAGVWATGVEAALPSDAGVNPLGSVNSVSCAAAGDCSAVGTYRDSSNDGHGLLLTESAGLWATGLEAALPANAGTQTGSSVNFSVSSVSCASPGNCAAVGQYADSSGHLQGLLLSETAGTWTTGVQAPLPADAATDPSVSVNSVSCASVGNCTAVGQYADSSGHSQGLLLTETAGVWASAEAGLPANVGTSTGVLLSSVSCASAGNCAAAGRYTDSSGQTEGLLMTESSATWATGLEAVPVDGAFIPSAFVNAVSCASAGNCAAVGSQVLLWSAAPASPTMSASGPPSASAGSAISSSSIAAMLAGGSAPIGTVTFKVFGPQSSPPASCTSGGTTVGSGIVLGDGSSHPPAGFTPATAGDYWWFASYGGDPSDNPAASPCGAGMAETVVSLPSPSLSVSVPSSGTAGSAIAASSISSALSGGLAPTGTVTFKVFGPQSSPPASCTSGATTVGSASASGNGTYHPSAGFTPAAAGDYWWFASYGGDVSDNPAASACGAGMARTVVAAPSVVVPPPVVGPGPPATGGAKAPVLSAVKLGSKRFAAKKGTKLRLTLSQPAKITVGITQTVTGHKVKHACRPSAEKGKKCAITIAKRTLAFFGQAGNSTFKFKLRGLAKGSYTAWIFATNPSGKSRTVRRKFTITHNSRSR